MTKSNAYIESGILECYVLGLSTIQENKEVVKMADHYEAIRKEIDAIVLAIEKYIYLGKVAPHNVSKGLVLSLIKKD